MNRVIDEYAEEIRKKLYIPLKENEELHKRLYEENNRVRAEGEYQRDYARILYSSSWKKLQGKMQLFPISSKISARNRLTHSLEVAQIARSIATQLGYEKEDIYTVETCSLAHDIGTPPYGHAGERYLNELCRDIGGYEANAQTFRILTAIELKRAEFMGLNLTYRTLLGITKYYNTFINSEEPRKFIYDWDYSLVNDIVRKTNVCLRILDTQIVDLADEIAYAVHDLEDGLSLGAFSCEQIIHEYCNNNYSAKSKEKLEKVFYESKLRSGYKDNKINSGSFSLLHAQEISSYIINVLIDDIGIVQIGERRKKEIGTNKNEEIGLVNYGDLTKGLKETVYNCVTQNDSIYLYERKGIYMLGWLYEFYLANTDLLPAKCQEKVGGSVEAQRRMIVDYLAGMTDIDVVETYNSLLKLCI